MSPAQSDASRINGAKSQGPVTPEGKAISSQNALRHGLCSKQVVLPGEDPDAFERLRADYVKRFRPQGDAELEVVETIAAASWRLKRMMRIESAILSDDNTDPMKALSLLIRYENQLNRTYDQSMKRLKDLQENGRTGVSPLCAGEDGRPKDIQRNEPSERTAGSSVVRDSSTNAPKPLESEVIKPLNLPAPRPAAFNPALKYPGAAV